MRYKVGDKVKIRKDLDIDRLYGRDRKYFVTKSVFEDTRISKNKSEKANNTLNSLKNKLNRMSVLCEMAESTKNIYIFVQMLKNCIYIFFNVLKLFIKFIFSRSE